MEIKKKIRYVLRNIKLRYASVRYLFFRFKNRKACRCIFIATPTHRNLGDHAVVYAQYCFLKDLIENVSFFEFSRAEYEKNAGVLGQIIDKDDLIVIDGGGNIGTLWIEEENKMRDIISRFSHNKIIMFPQTAYFEESEYGREEFRKTIETYDNHNNLLIMARDEKTFELLSNNLKRVQVIFIPDIVLYITDAEDVSSSEKREGILLCLREDSEGIYRDNDKEKLQQYLKENGYSFNYVSTMAEKSVFSNERVAFLRRKWTEFSACKLIITDRLHGMIFASITGTPCLAVDNVSGKVKGGYEWIKGLKYIHFCNSQDELIGKIDEYYNLTSTHYDKSVLTEKFKFAGEEIKNCLR